MKWVNILIIVVWSGLLHAETLDFNSSGKLFAPLVKDWELKKNVMGFPFIMFSPQDHGQKSNLSFLASGENLQFDEARMKKEIDQYKEIKQKWADQIGAKITKVFPLESSLNSKGHKIHTVGVNYLFDKQNYMEKSFYLECRGKLYFSKSLMLMENSYHAKAVDQIMKELDCE